MAIEVSGPYKTIEFNPLNELSELRAAVSGASKEDKKLSWYKNAVKDLGKLDAEISANGKVISIDTKRSNKIYSDNVTSFALPVIARSESSSDVAISLLSFRSGFAGEKSVDFKTDSSLALGMTNNISSEDSELKRQRMLAAAFDAHLDTILPWPEQVKPEELPDNVTSLVEEKAKRSRTSELLRAKSAAQMNLWLALGIGGAAVLALVAGGFTDAFGIRTGIKNLVLRESQPVTPVTAPAIPGTTIDANKYANYITSLNFPTEDSEYGFKAHKGGKVEAYLAEFYGATGEDDKFNPHRDALSYEIRKASDTEYTNRYNAGLDLFKKLNTGLGSYPDNDPWVHTRSSTNHVVEFKTLTGEGWKVVFEGIGGEYVAPAVVAESEEKDEEAEVVPASEPTAGPRRGAPAVGPGFQAGPETYMCSDGLKNVADALIKAQANKCIHDSLVGQGVDINKLTGFDGKLSTLISQHPQLRNMFPLNQELAMYVKDGSTVKTMGFQFSDSRPTNLLSGDKIVNVNDEVVVLTDGNQYALFLKRCGNFVFGIPQPKVAETPAPIVIPTATTTSTATVVEVQRPATATPTRTATPVPAVREYVAPAQPPVEIIPTIQPVPPGEGLIFKWCDNTQTGIPRELDSTDFACDANFRVEFLDPSGNIVLHVLDNVRTTNGVARIRSPQPGMLFRAIERLDLLPANLNLLKDDIYGSTVPAGSNIDIRSGNINIAFALNGPDIILPPPPPPVEGRFPVCVDIFGRTENLTLYELRQRVAGLNLGIGNVDLLSVPQLQDILNRRCIVSVTATQTPSPTSTGTPVIFLSSTPTPDMTPTGTPGRPSSPTPAPTNVETLPTLTPVGTRPPTLVTTPTAGKPNTPTSAPTNVETLPTFTKGPTQPVPPTRTAEPQPKTPTAVGTPKTFNSGSGNPPASPTAVRAS